MLSEDILLSGIPTRIDGPTSVILCDSCKDIENLAQELDMTSDLIYLDKNTDSKAAISVVDSSIKRGKWCILADGMNEQVLRHISTQVIPKQVHAFHEKFRLFTIGGKNIIPQYPTLFRSSMVYYQSPLLWELHARSLANAVENANDYHIEKEKEFAKYFTQHDQIELMRKCSREEHMLSLIPYCMIDSRSNDVGILDIALEKRWSKCVELICASGGNSSMVDLAYMASSEELEQLLEVMLCSPTEKVPFDELWAAHNAAETGNEKVLRIIFNARADRRFTYDCYPLAVAMLYSNDVAQLVIDRMECVGYPPFRTPEVALYFLTEVLTMASDPLPENIVHSVTRFCQCLIDNEATPCVIKSKLISKSLSYPSLLEKLLEITDVHGQASEMIKWYMSELCTHPQAEVCLVEYLKLTSPGSDERSDIVRELITKPSAIKLLEISLLEVDVEKHIIFNDDSGIELQRTPLMLTTEYPGFPEACKLIIQLDENPNSINESGLNVLQQLVVDCCSNPLQYVNRLGEYGQICRLLIESGVSSIPPNYDQTPGFTTTLSSYCERCDFAPLVYELLHAKDESKMLFISDGLLSCIVNYTLYSDAVGCQRPPLEDRFESPSHLYSDRPSLPKITCLDTIENIFSFLDFYSIFSFSLSCCCYYLTSLRNSLWDTFLDIPCCYDKRFVLSSKESFKSQKMNKPCHRWIKCSKGDGYECLYTGKVIGSEDELSSIQSV